MPKPSATARLAEEIARRIVANQTRARLAIAMDAALIAAHEVLQLGPGRAAAFAQAYSDAMEQLATLRKCGCTEGQGFFLSKPVTLDEFKAMMIGDKG